LFGLPVTFIRFAYWIACGRWYRALPLPRFRFLEH
jgi:hypothetical protein